MLDSAIYMQYCYLSDFDPEPLLTKRDLLTTRNDCLQLACSAFEEMQLPPEAVKIVKEIEVERNKAFEYAQLAAEPESLLAKLNACRANQSRLNVKILTSQLKQMCNESIT